LQDFVDLMLFVDKTKSIILYKMKEPATINVAGSLVLFRRCSS
jgi:hypothetical protein